jgi:cobalt-zinc-cadmium efflux system outer membrane protein
VVFRIIAVAMVACGVVSAPVLAQSPAASAQAAPTVPLTIEGALMRAMAENPAVAAARLRRATSLAEVGVARERLNPDAHLEIDKETPHEAYTFDLPLELGGKRSRRIAVAEATVQSTEAEIALTVADVRANVRDAYFGRVLAEARLTLLQELRDVATRARDAAQQRFDAGSAPRLEVVQAQLALAEAQNQADAAQGAVTAARAQLNALLGLPLGDATPLATPLDAGSAPAIDAAMSLARTGSAELQLLDRRIQEQRARLSLAQALRVPDVTPEAAITHGAEPEFVTGWRAAVGISIPILTTHRAGVLVEQTALTQLTAERDATLARITGQVTSAVALAEAQRQQFIRYRDTIVPQALDVERMAEDSYRLGQTGITALLQALQSSGDVRLRSLQAASDFQSALTDLERAVGAPLP